MHERFVELCELASPTGSERAVADRVLEMLREDGISDVTEDDAAGPARAGAGNLIARLPGPTDGPWVAFFAHLDTVPHDGPVRVIEDEGVYRSAGNTILGADNKAAVVVLLELGAELAASGERRCGVELVFTVAEEQGLRGAHAFDPGALRSEVGFVLDHATPIGEVIVAAPTYKRITAEFSGRSAHAGLRPEEGRSAISAATAAIEEMTLGRLDEGTTANLGVIEGGSAPNVVPGSCRIEGEARSLDGERAAEVASAIVEACTWAAGERDCGVNVDVTEFFRGYRVEPDAREVVLASAALRAEGIEPRLVSTGGGSDANALRAAGMDCLLLANGTEANHTPDESVSREALETMLLVCRGIVREAGEGPGGAAA